MQQTNNEIQMDKLTHNSLTIQLGINPIKLRVLKHLVQDILELIHWLLLTVRSYYMQATLSPSLLLAQASGTTSENIKDLKSSMIQENTPARILSRSKISFRCFYLMLLLKAPSLSLIVFLPDCLSCFPTRKSSSFEFPDKYDLFC